MKNPIFAVAYAIMWIIPVSFIVINEKKYDERQLLARNTAFKAAFITLITYCFGCGIINCLDIVWADLPIQMFLGALISITFFSAYCIIMDAYFTSTKKRKWNFITYHLSTAVLSTLSVLIDAGRGEALWSSDGLSPLALKIAFSASFFVIGIISLVKTVSDRKVTK